MSKNKIYEIALIFLVLLLFTEIHGVDIKWQLVISNSVVLILLIDKLFNSKQNKEEQK